MKMIQLKNENQHQVMMARAEIILKTRDLCSFPHQISALLPGGIQITVRANLSPPQCANGNTEIFDMADKWSNHHSDLY